MYKRILIPTDGSACSRRASQQGIELAARLEAGLTFLYVVEEPFTAVLDTAVYPEDLYEELRRAGEEILGDVLALARAKGVAARSLLVEHRRAVTAILEAAKDADLIAMATHGRRGFDRYVFGSVAEGVLRRSRVPCLMFRCAESDEDAAGPVGSVGRPETGEPAA